MSEEWRVEVELDDESHGYTLGERLRAVRLDDDAVQRLGDDALVTRDGSRLFVYVGSEAGALEAECVARDLLTRDGLSARISVTRWHEAEREWKDPSVPLPRTEEERRAGAERHRAAAEAELEEGHGYEWWVRVEVPSLGAAHELADTLRQQGLTVRRRFRHLLVGAPTEDAARELAERVRAAAPDEAELMLQTSHWQDPFFVFVEAHKPGIARDLGL